MRLQNEQGRKGSPIIMMKNLDPKRLCNVTRLIEEDLHENLIVAKIITSAFKDETVLIHRIKHILSRERRRRKEDIIFFYE